MYAVLLANAASTLALLGLIWTIQLVHYPMLAAVRPGEFVRWHRFHASRISIVVVPLMGIEAATAALLCVSIPPAVPAALPWAGLGLVGVHLASTAVLQVPEHRRLSRGYDGAAVRRLVRTNWIRTVVWSLRAVLVLSMLAVGA
jgi:hypothetical protein